MEFYVVYQSIAFAMFRNVYNFWHLFLSKCLSTFANKVTQAIDLKVINKTKSFNRFFCYHTW